MRESAACLQQGHPIYRKFLAYQRYIEIQVLCNNHSNALWLGSWDCSLWHRHQKVI
ncbi:ATP-binding protein [Sodalis-like endosymbiont of Proechinophthirus fluctus]|uniref:ATP-binding protein n=1 Tax=Sodalis-like endosymbiont of Proechinophthirus fluctus TaxID=1462730 RepID=UPI00195B4B5F